MIGQRDGGLRLGQFTCTFVVVVVVVGALEFFSVKSFSNQQGGKKQNDQPTGTSLPNM